jgi:hypothetical protein
MSRIIPDNLVVLFHQILSKTQRKNGRPMTKVLAGRMILKAFPDIFEQFADEHSALMRLNTQHREKFASSYSDLVRLRGSRKVAA